MPESKASHYFVERKVSEALALAPVTPDMHVLEVGCSFGHMTFLLARKAAHVTAVDFSAESIDLARQRAAHYGVTNIDWQVADAEDMAGLEDESFDAAYSFSTLRFCPNPALALLELKRLVKLGASVVVDYPNRYCPWFGLGKLLMGISPHVHDRLYSPYEAVELMKLVGLGEVTLRQFLLVSKRVPDDMLPLAKLVESLVEELPILKQLTAIIMVRGVKDGVC